jgi:hypothetical protein
MNHVKHFPGIIPPAVANGLLNLLCLTPDLAAATRGSLWALFAPAHLPVQVEQFVAQAPVLRHLRVPPPAFAAERYRFYENNPGEPLPSRCPWQKQLFFPKLLTA